MFERLTERTSDGIAYTKIPLNESHLNKRGVIEQCFTGFVADRLAAYEDTGLSPEQVQELAKAKTDGRLAVLPFVRTGKKKIGGNVMTKLEQAIAYFEDAIRESDEIIAECSEALQKELMEQKKHFEVALKIMKKWNGEGECKYCKNPSDYLAICQNYETRIFVGISGEYLQIFDEDYPGFCDNHKINFCPICGRKLS